jgi:hypothetical protein
MFKQLKKIAISLALLASTIGNAQSADTLNGV